MNAIQIILITLLAALKKVDQKGPQIFIYNTVFWGFLAGAIMGDIMTGMAIGATFQLMSLGVAAIGGTSVPDYQIGAIISIAIAVSTGQGIEAGIAVGLPVAMLAVQLDVLGNIAHGIFVRKAQTYATERKWNSFNMMYIICIIITALTTGLPTFLAVAFGDVLVTTIIDAMPVWFTSGWKWRYLQEVNSMMTNNEKKAILSNKDLNQVGIRWFMSIETFNYETQLAGSYAFAVMPALRKIYKDDSELTEAMDNHFKYFNCMPWLTNLILGATLALEDNQGIQAKDAVQDLKVSLMGPLSGIGDSIFFILIPTILGSITAYMAQDGNPLGMIVWCIYGIVIGFIRIKSVSWGYKGGLKLVNELGKKLSVFTNSISAMGLTVVGALIPSLVKVTTPLVFKMGEVTQEVQTILDTIMPAMIPAIFTFISYKLLGRNVKISWLILIIIVFSWICAAFGILA